MELKSKLYSPTSIAPLVVFRCCFGLLMTISLIRFWAKGWIQQLYIDPVYHFSYLGFEWIKPIGQATYLLFIICALSAIFVMIGYKYRWAMSLFFLSFTYIELMDKTTYLNHYYFISVLSFLMIFLPASGAFSLDAYLKKRSYKSVPKFTILSIQILVTIVYFYAGLAKLNSDWLCEALPLKIWLSGKYDIPIIGNTILTHAKLPWLMSWVGCFYDLSIPFLLWYRKTRWLAFILVVVFHLLTSILFPIGMFPYIMIFSAFIFFSPEFHQNLIQRLKQRWASTFSKASQKWMSKSVHQCAVYPMAFPRLTHSILGIFFLIQVATPFRYLAYPGELFWTEQGYRFSWRVMLIEKTGQTLFKVKHQEAPQGFIIQNEDYLTEFQIKQMSFQPDFIHEFAHFLGSEYEAKGHQNVEVFVESFVSLNGRLNQQFIDPSIDLYQLPLSLQHKFWILPFKDEIKGL